MTSANAPERETKSARVQLRLTPTAKAALVRLADGRSLNDTVERLIRRADQEGVRL